MTAYASLFLLVSFSKILILDSKAELRGRLFLEAFLERLFDEICGCPHSLDFRIMILKSALRIFRQDNPGNQERKSNSPLRLFSSVTPSILAQGPEY